MKKFKLSFLTRKIISHTISKKEDTFSQFLSELLSFNPKNIKLYQRAFTHSSFYKNQSFKSFERLEFLGDAVLSLIVSKYLFNKLNSVDEGMLTELRSKIVRRKNLNIIGKELNLMTHLRSNTPKELFGDDIHGNILEAVIGAVFMDKGIERSTKFVYRLIIKKTSYKPH